MSAKRKPKSKRAKVARKPKPARKPKRPLTRSSAQKRRAALSPLRGARAQQRAPRKPQRPIVMRGQETRWPREIRLDRVVKRRDLGDLAGLAQSIDARGGLLQPIAITPDNQLIAGQRRLAAWPLTEKFRKEPIPVRVIDVDSILAGERDENAQRKDFSPSESVALMDGLIAEAQARAKERQRAHAGTAPGRKATDANEETGRAADEVAKYLGRDRKTLEKAKAVVEAAKAEPKKFAALLEQMDKTGKVNGPFRRLTVLRQVDDIAEKKKNGKLDLPKGKYDRMVVDMPWPYEADDPAPAERGRAVRDYPTMSLAEMAAMPIRQRMAKDCVVYFWVNNFHVENAYRVLRAWGLDKFPTILTWTKDQIGRGQRLREQTEQCIIAIKGKPVWNLTNQSTRLDAPVREDSRKPDEFYALIDALTPAQRSLELFARRELPEGWDGFGDQVGKFKDVETFGNIDAGLLKVLGAIAAGAPVAFNENDHVVKGLFTGKTKRKLTKAGQAKLAELREQADERAALAALPGEIEDLIADYRATLVRRHDAAMAADADRVAQDSRRLELLQMRAHGGTRFGMACDDSPAERLRRESAAPIGEEPLWGQRGMFRLAIDGTPYLVAHDEDIGFDVYAEDGGKPFISETGFMSLAPCDDIALGVTVAQQAEAYIREEIDTPLNKAGSKRAPRGKNDPLPNPEVWYRLPVSWDERDDGAPVTSPIAAGGDRPWLRAHPGDEAKPVASKPKRGKKSSQSAVVQPGDRADAGGPQENSIPPMRYGVAGATDQINAKTLAVLRRADARGLIGWHDDGVGDGRGASFARVVMRDDGGFASVSPRDPVPPSIAAAIDLRRRGNDVEVTAYHGARGADGEGLTFLASCMPYAKVAKFLRAWRASDPAASAARETAPSPLAGEGSAAVPQTGVGEGDPSPDSAGGQTEQPSPRKRGEGAATQAADAGDQLDIADLLDIPEFLRRTGGAAA